MRLTAIWTAHLLAVGWTLPISAGDLTWRNDPGVLALRDGGTTVWEFRYGRDVPKPFFHPLALPGGGVVTENAPSDHRWHHGLWFSWKFLNGANYWEPGDGTSFGATEWHNVHVATEPGGDARISMDLAYKSSAGAVVLREARQIRVAAPSTGGSYAIDWTMTFTAPAGVLIDRTPIAGEPDGKTWGGYAGLSFRFNRAFEPGVLTSSTTGAPGDGVTDNRMFAIRGRPWLELSGSVGGTPVGVAMLDHAKNPRTPTPWYLVLDRQKQFTFAQAALVYYEPLRLGSGEKLVLRYRVIIHPGHWQLQDLKRAYEQYIQQKEDPR